MIYLKINWLHKFENEPNIIYSELDSLRNEIRKIELYKNGSFGLAFLEMEYNNTGLSKEPLPSNEEIESDPQFKVENINQKDFEAMWNKLYKTIN